MHEHTQGIGHVSCRTVDSLKATREPFNRYGLKHEYASLHSEETMELTSKADFPDSLDSHIEMVIAEATDGTGANEESLICCVGRNKMGDLRSRAAKWLKPLMLILLMIGYVVFVVFAIYLNPRRAIFICIVTPLVAYTLINILTRGKLGKLINRSVKRLKKATKTSRRFSIWTRRVSTVVVLLAIVAFLVYDIWDDLERWTPLGGLVLLVVVSVIFSKHPSKINWVTVIWGLVLQFIMGLIILRWGTGFRACQWVGQQVTIFLGYTDKGTEFVFGEKYTYHPIVFKILPVVVFYSAIVSCLYYVGAMQVVIKSIAVCLRLFMSATPIESFATAAHIFFGLVECSVTLRPFFSKLTVSEIHAIMTSGYATVAGTIIAAYVEFGVPAEHVISASFMSAPAALAIAKLSIPETEVSKINSLGEIKQPKGQETNLIEALSIGATTVIKMIAYIVVNLIAFIAVLAFLDAILSYLGSLVNYPDLSFQLICSYAFMPLAAALGVPWSEANLVGGLIGKKIVINEFLSFAELGGLIKAGDITDKSAVLATYILCGFGSIAALGINLGALSSNAPERRSDFARLSVRSMINGNIACFMTACVAGLLYQDFSQSGFLQTAVNTTTTTMAVNASAATVTASFVT